MPCFGDDDRKQSKTPVLTESLLVIFPSSAGIVQVQISKDEFKNKHSIFSKDLRIYNSVSLIA